jgi:integrase
MTVSVRKIVKIGKPVRWRVDYFDQYGIRHRKNFNTSGEAHVYRQKIEEELKNGTHRPGAAKMVVRELAAEYREAMEARHKRGERMTRGSLQFIIGHLENYILAVPGKKREDKWAYLVTPFEKGIGEVRVAHLTTRVICEFRDRLRDAGLSVITTRKVITAVSGMMSFAKTKDYIAANPCQGVTVIGPRNESSKKIDPPSREDLALVLQEASPTMQLKILFAASTGLRAGEMHALRWGKVNFATREITVDTSLDKYGIEDGQGAKTGAGNRTIPIGAPLAKVLQEWRQQSEHAKDTDPVFPNADGSLRHHSSMLSYEFFPIFKRLDQKHQADPNGFPKVKKFRWHALRHFAVSTWIEAGLSPKTVQTFAGHSTMAMTMDRYGHLFKSDDHGRLMDRVGASLFGGNSGTACTCQTCGRPLPGEGVSAPLLPNLVGGPSRK